MKFSFGLSRFVRRPCPAGSAFSEPASPQETSGSRGYRSCSFEVYFVRFIASLADAMKGRMQSQKSIVA